MFAVSQKKSVALETKKNIMLLFKLSLQHAITTVYLCLPFHFFPSLLKHADKKNETNKQL